MANNSLEAFVLTNGSERQVRCRYGLEPYEFYAMLFRSEGFCSLCESPFSKTERGCYPCIDHCYTTGQIRGLLCQSCNVGLGHFSDSPSLLKKAAQYIEDNKMQNLQSKSTRETQNHQILSYLKRRRAITQAAAIAVFGCSRLSAVIHRLKKQGYEIDTRMVKGFKGRYAEYALKDKANA